MQAEGAIQITNENFEEEITKFPGVVLVDFWAVWCGPCIKMTPIIADLVKKYADNPNVRIAQLNVDEAQEAQEPFHVLSIPTFIVFANGQPVGSTIGAQPAAPLVQLIEDALKNLAPAK